MPKAKAAAKTPKVTAVKDPFTKTQLLTTIAENTGLAKKEVASVLDELATQMHRHLKKRGAGHFTVPGLMKVVTVRKPATKAKKNVPNPFKPGEFMDVKAKPARTIVKVRPLAKLKSFVD
jgi:nucleoid DNA-binding protein